MGRKIKFTTQSLYSHTKAHGPSFCLGAGEKTNLLPLARIETNCLGCENPSLRVFATPTVVYWPRIVNNKREKSTKFSWDFRRKGTTTYL